MATFWATFGIFLQLFIPTSGHTGPRPAMAKKIFGALGVKPFCRNW